MVDMSVIKRNSNFRVKNTINKKLLGYLDIYLNKISNDLNTFSEVLTQKLDNFDRFLL